MALQQIVFQFIFRSIKARPNIQVNHNPEDEERLQIEKSRRRYGIGCWKIYERSEKILSTKVQSQKPIQIPRGGLIELCPCLRVCHPVLFDMIILNIHKYNLLTGWETIPCEDITLRWFGIGIGRASLAHECTLERHPAAKVQVTTVPEWEANMKGITKLTSLYAFQVELESTSERHLKFAGIKTPLRCSGKNIKWLRRFFDEAGAKVLDFGRKCSVGAALYHCDEVEGAPIKRTEQSRILIVTVVRKLRCEDDISPDSYVVTERDS
jgi:hypothetical protein